MRFAKRMFIAALASLALLAGLASLPASGQKQGTHKARYTIKDLGTLGGSFAQAGGISDTGWVEGFSSVAGEGAYHEFLWHDGVMTDLGTLGGPDSFSEYRPSDRGDAGGESETAVPDPNGEDFCGFGNYVTCLSFYWHNGVMTALPNLGGTNGAGYGVNDLGELAGTAENKIVEPTCEGIGLDQTFQYKPVIWKGGRVRELPTYPGDPVGIAYAINNNEQAVGQTGPCGTGTLATVDHGLLWQNGKAISIGNLGGTMNHTPEDINDLGDVAGFSDLPGDITFHAYLWRRGATIDLGTLPGDIHSIGEAINIKGEIVGRSSDADFNGAGYLWENGVMTDLNTLIPSDSPLFITNANTINDEGQIAGAALTSSGDTHVYLMSPVGPSVFLEARNSVPHRVITRSDTARKLLRFRGRRFSSHFNYR